MGSMLHPVPGCYGWYPFGAAGSGWGWATDMTRGVMSADSSIAIEGIEDGTSYTITTLLELRAGVADIDMRGVWALPGTGVSDAWGHGYVGDCSGPNAANINSDDTYDCTAIQSAVGGQVALAEMGMPCGQPLAELL